MLVTGTRPPRNASRDGVDSQSPGIPNVPANPALQVFQIVVRVLLAVILIWAGLSKVADPVSFHTTLLEYQVPIPGLLLKLVAIILPWLELLCGLMLLTNVYRRAALLWAAALFSVFLVMVGQALPRGLDISCGCLNLAIVGIAETSDIGRFLESVGFAFVRNTFLLVCAVFLLRRPGRSRDEKPVNQ